MTRSCGCLDVSCGFCEVECCGGECCDQCCTCTGETDLPHEADRKAARERARERRDQRIADQTKDAS